MRALHTHLLDTTHIYWLYVCLPVSLCEPCESACYLQKTEDGGVVSAEIRVMDGCQLFLDCCEDGGTGTHQRQRQARQEFLVEN